MGVKVKLTKARLSFPELWEATQFEAGKGKHRYDASFLVEPGSENDKEIRAAIKEAANEAWGEKAKAKVKQLAGDSGKFCYQDGDLKEYDGYAGNWCLTTHRNQDQGAPAIVGRGGKNDVLTAASGKPYAGCYVNATVEIWAQKGQYPGMRATLIGVQFVEDGDAFAGTPASADDFDQLDASEDDDDDFGSVDETEVVDPEGGNDNPDDDDGF